ncbi:DUF2860 family protein [Alkalimarinus sediminis]|uniref:DUF2860 domain-containing protein n=1 Tax=Alkalimarinus sediminis TaxID=1632866 RepID=A0A9E8HML3_9ALTE|nr:DUF2860 family protein [Alkalimarinus sediminis]UZW76107.1 DUF2860 domain-containing protein [Alkalimarinus sediminis]
MSLLRQSSSKSGLILKSVALASSLILMAGHTNSRPLAEKPGWGADLALTAGYNQKQSQFNVDDDNSITQDLNNSGKKTSGLMTFPLARLDYTLESLKTQFFVGNSRENVGKGEFQIEFGGSHQFNDNSTLTLAYFPELPFIGETWKDPYLTGKVREKTEETAQGGRIELKNVAGSLLDVQYAFADSEIDSELSGTNLAYLSDLDRSKLHRDAFYQRISVDHLFPLSANFMLKPGVFYTRANAKGDANSSDEYAIRLQMIFRENRHLLTGSATFGHLKADVENPVFDKKEKTDRASLFALYKYQKPFNLENWSLLAIGFLGETDSNIDFYSRSGLGIGVGAAYAWR